MSSRPEGSPSVGYDGRMADSARTRRPLVLDEATAVLARTPATLDAMLRGLPDGWIHAHEGGETWSPFDVIGHLIHGEQTDWVPRARIILEHGEARAFDKFDRFAQFELIEGPHPRQPARRVRGAPSRQPARPGGARDLGRRPRAARRAPGPWRRHARPAAGDVGRARPGSRRPGRARDGPAVQRCGRAVARLPARHQRGAGLTPATLDRRRARLSTLRMSSMP